MQRGGGESKGAVCAPLAEQLRGADCHGLPNVRRVAAVDVPVAFGGAWPFHFISFPGRLHEVVACWPFCLCDFACPVLTLNNDKNTCRAALALVREHGGENKEKTPWAFCPSGKQRVFFNSLRRTQVNCVWSAGST